MAFSFLTIVYKMATVEELFEQFKQLPDFDRYPLPEAYYTKFGLKKPRPGDLMENLHYNPPPYMSLNENGKVEIRGPVEGGVREIKDLQYLPVEVKRMNEETLQLEEYPAPKVQSADDRLKDFDLTKLSLPKADSTKETQPVLDLQSSGLSGAFPYIASAVPYHPS